MLSASDVGVNSSCAGGIPEVASCAVSFSEYAFPSRGQCPQTMTMLLVEALLAGPTECERAAGASQRFRFGQAFETQVRRVGVTSSTVWRIRTTAHVMVTSRGCGGSVRRRRLRTGQ